MTTALEFYWAQLERLRCPIGLMLLQANQYESVEEIAARSGASLVDFRDTARRMLPPGSRFVDFRPDTLFTLLRSAHDSSSSSKLLVKNFDLGLARLRVADRHRLWETLVNNFPPNSNKSVVVAMPDAQTATHLLPPEETLKQWLDSKRAFRVAAV